MAALQEYLPVLNIIQEASRQLSIPVPASAYGSNDQNAELMGSLINNVGRMLLANRRCFQQFRATHTLTGDASRTAFDIPTDFGRLIDDTGWSYAIRRPVRLATAAEWNALLAWVGTGSPTFQPIFRIINDAFTFLIAPAVGEVIKFEYVKRYWVIDGLDIVNRKAYCTIDSDTPMFDWTLMLFGIKMKWKEAKGFANEGDVTDFNDRLDQVFDADIPGQIITLGQGGGLYNDPLIGGHNMPATGYGD